MKKIIYPIGSGKFRIGFILHNNFAYMVSKEMLLKLKIILKEEYGRELPDSQIFIIGNQIVNYYKALKRLKSSRY